MPRAITVPATDGWIDGFVHTPDNGAGRHADAHPGVVLFTDIGGVRPCYHAKAQTLADAGYAVLMPNIYYRDVSGTVVPEGRSFRDDDVRATLRAYAARLTPTALTDDFDALVAAIDNDTAFAPGPIGVVGYCLTGGFSLRMAARHSARVGAAAAFHAAHLATEEASSPHTVVGAIAGRVYCGHADGDAVMPPEQIARLDHALAAAGVDFTTELYKGAIHGYMASDAPHYDAAADARHYKRLFTLLDETLGSHYSAR